VAEKTFTNNTKQAPKDRSCVYIGLDIVVLCDIYPKVMSKNCNLCTVISNLQDYRLQTSFKLQSGFGKHSYPAQVPTKLSAVLFLFQYTNFNLNKTLFIYSVFASTNTVYIDVAHYNYCILGWFIIRLWYWPYFVSLSV